MTSTLRGAIFLSIANAGVVKVNKETNEILEYIKLRVRSNPNESDIYWLPLSGHSRGEKVFNAKHAGKSIGCVIDDRCGSFRCVFSIGFNGSRYVFFRSRVKWAIHNGEWPGGQIDHISCDASDDRLCNLREATNEDNSANKRIYSTNSSGAKGVRFNNKTGKWTARITKGYKEMHLGSFLTMIEAMNAYEKAAISLNGEFARVR